MSLIASKALPLVIGIPFTVYSLNVVVVHGYFGFVGLAQREPWGMQMLLDLTLALFLVGSWIRRDAKAFSNAPATGRDP